MTRILSALTPWFKSFAQESIRISVLLEFKFPLINIYKISIGSTSTTILISFGRIIFLKNEVSIQIRANENKIYVANFAGSAGYYSIFWNDGLSMTEFYKIYKKIAKIETQRWITHCKKPLLKRGFNISSSLQSSLCRYRQGF